MARAPGLMLIHGNRAEQLRDVLVSWVHHQPLAPLQPEVILVQSNGIAQWLRLALAEAPSGGGIAAGLDFLLPSHFVWQAYRAVLGPARVPEQSPLDKERLLWRVLRLLPQCLDAPGFEGLRGYLADDADQRKRIQLCQRLADLYDQYQVYRADWLDAWARGQAVVPDALGRAQPLAPGQRWQALLWRAILDDLGPADASSGRAAIHAAFVERTAQADLCPASPLPERVLVFGISSLPRQAFEALAGLARHVQVLVFVHNPCEHYWADIVADRDVLRARFRRQKRRPGTPGPLDAATTNLHEQTQPLLASWGRQGRDFIRMLDDFDDPAGRAEQARALATIHERIDLFSAWRGQTLLQQLQDDIRDLRPLAETRTQWSAIDPRTDESICFHVAHSPLRELQVLHDRLLDAFARDPTLRARDVIVMVPDIDAYAPHIQAVFGALARDDARHIPFVVADRGLRHHDPLVIVLEQLLSLPRQRLGVQQLLEWLDVPALRDRFGLTGDDLSRLPEWAEAAQVHWGINAAHRASFGLQQAAASARTGTWSFGVQRLLLGYASGAALDADGFRASWDGDVPCAQASGLQAAAVGRLARLLDTLEAFRQRLLAEAPPAAWVACFSDLLEACFLARDPRDQHTLMRFREGLQDWLERCAQAGFDEPVPAFVAADQALAALDAPRLGQRFFAGAVTFATLMPMRAIPFRHVCLLGMQDGAYPRQQVAADFDLMATHPRVGDRSRREDDRYLFLEALLSARDRLYLSWVGRSLQDNSRCPPSVLVAQLRDHLDRGWDCVSGGALSQALTTEHALQPFSPRYFPLHPDGGPWFTYAREWRPASQTDEAPKAEAAARASAGRTPALLPLWNMEEALDLARLQAFLRHPVKAFFQQRLRVHFAEADPVPDGLEPYVPHGLRGWELRDQLLEQAVRVGPDPARMGQAVAYQCGVLQRAGALPSGPFGEQVGGALLEALQPAIEGYAQACEHWPIRDALPLRMRSTVTLGEGGPWPFEDSLPDWRRDVQGRWARVVLLASNLVDERSHYRLRIALPHWLASLAAWAHGRPHALWLISPKGRLRLAAPPTDEAAALWRQLWAAWGQGMRMPLPVELDTANTWLRAEPQTDPASASWQRAQVCFEVQRGRDPYLQRAFEDFAALCAGDGFFDWAQRLYAPLMGAVQASMDDAQPTGEGA